MLNIQAADQAPPFNGDPQDGAYLYLEGIRLNPEAPYQGDELFRRAARGQAPPAATTTTTTTTTTTAITSGPPLHRPSELEGAYLHIESAIQQTHLQDTRRHRETRREKPREQMEEEEEEEGECEKVRGPSPERDITDTLERTPNNNNNSPTPSSFLSGGLIDWQSLVSSSRKSARKGLGYITGQTFQDEDSSSEETGGGSGNSNTIDC